MNRQKNEGTPVSNAVMVVHGPEAFDSGDAGRLADLVRPREILVAGVMGRCAAEASGLPVRCTDTRPSIVLAAEQGRAFLVNRGKTPASGRIFGELVAGRLPEGCGLVHIECSSRTLFVWNEGDAGLAGDLAGLTGFPVVEAAGAAAARESGRTIRGCIPGEAVFVNGIVIGTATAETVVLASGTGTIEAIAGIDLKQHGVEKLLRGGVSDLAAAWCKSGSVRSAAPRHAGRARDTGRIAVIDHAGHTLYREIETGVSGVLSIGDDTTAVCGHICAHHGIPVFGVVDGDADDIILAGYAPGSVVVETVGERDDDLGCEIAASLGEEPVVWEEWVAEMLRRLEGRVRIAVDRREESDAVR